MTVLLSLGVYNHLKAREEAEWMADLGFYILFNSISVMLGRYEDDNEKLCAMEPNFKVRKELFPQLGFNLERLDQ